MWSTILADISFPGLGIWGTQDTAGESSTEERSPCENALITVLPLFVYMAGVMKASYHPDPADLIDDNTRKLHSFCVSFEMEAGMLHDNLNDIAVWWSEVERNEREDYTEALTDILLIFEHLVSRKVLNANRGDGCLILGDQVFLKLHALCLRKEIGNKYSFPRIQQFIRLPAKENKRREILEKLESFNRSLDALKKDQGIVDPENSRSDFKEQRPPYEARKALDQLYKILDTNWKLSCTEYPHETKLRLSTFGRNRPARSEKDDEVSHDIDVLFSTHPPSLRWRQGQIKIFKVGSRPSTPKLTKVTWLETTVSAKKKTTHSARRPVPIESICIALLGLDVRRSCLLLRTAGEEIGSDSDHSRYRMWKLPPGSKTPRYLLFSDEEPTVSLETLLKTCNARFTLKERRTLAVILGHALLHICESSWLPKELTKGNVSFLRAAPNTADLRKPYLSVQFHNNDIGEQTEQDAWISNHPSPSLLGLGIILIELEHGPIENMRQEDDLIDGEIFPDTNRMTAERCLKDKRLWDQNPYPAFKRAVSACIDGDFLFELLRDDAEEGENRDQDRLNLQVAIYNNVIRYLEDELRAIDKQVASNTLNETDFDLCFEYLSNMAKSSYQSYTPPIASWPSPAAFTSRKPHLISSPTKGGDRVFDSKVFSILENGEVHEKVNRAEDFHWELSKIHKLLSPGETNELWPVKVAILDTGIREELRKPNNVVTYHDFIDPGFREKITPAQDKTGHGSDMVYLLHKTAPHAEIYVARVFGGDSGDAGTAERVASAIKKARDEWKVDIISMSFGFKEGGRNLENVINDTRNTLMFAASTNFGATEKNPIRYPARHLNRVICVNAADGIGHPATFNPPEDPIHSKRNFSILGEAVPLQGEPDSGTETVKPRYGNGTSMATPIAAGVAALVLEFSKQKGPHEKVRNAADLKTQNGMLSIFHRMSGKGKKAGFQFIAPWKVLSSESTTYKQQMSDVCNAISEAIEGRNDW